MNETIDMGNREAKRHPTAGLVAIIVVAGLLRAGGLLWGISNSPLPPVGFHPDEARQAAAAIDFPRDLSWRRDVRYPTLLPYAAGAIAWPVRRAADVFFGRPMGETAAVAWLLARLLSLACGLGAIGLTYVLARKWFDAGAGLLAAGFVAVAPYPVQLSAWATNDVASSFFLLLAVLAALRLFEHRRLRDFIGAGAAIGLLLGTRYTGWVAGVFALAVLAGVRREEERGFFPLMGVTAAAVAAAAGVFLLTTPAPIFHPASLIQSLRYLADECQRFGLPPFDPATWWAFLRAFTDSLGGPMALVVGIGAVIGSLPPRPRGLAALWAMLAAFLVPFVLMGPNLLLPRYAVMVIPLLCAVAAGGIVRFARGRSGRVRAAIIAAVAIAMSSSLVIGAWAVALRWDDPRLEAAAFIEERLPAGMAIGWGGIGDFECWDWTLPPVDAKRFVLVDPLVGPDYLVVSSICTDRLLAALDDPGRFFGPPRRGVHPLQAWFPWLRVPDADVLQFAEDVVRQKGRRYRYHLIADFRRNVPFPMEFPPPEIRIYARDGDVSP